MQVHARFLGCPALLAYISRRVVNWESQEGYSYGWVLDIEFGFEAFHV